MPALVRAGEPSEEPSGYIPGCTPLPRKVIADGEGEGRGTPSVERSEILQPKDRRDGRGGATGHARGGARGRQAGQGRPAWLEQPRGRRTRRPASGGRIRDPPAPRGYLPDRLGRDGGAGSGRPQP